MLRRLFSDLGEKQVDATQIYYDNRSASAITNNPILHGCVKHTNLKYHFIRSIVANNQISFKFCNSEEPMATYLLRLFLLKSIVTSGQRWVYAASNKGGVLEVN